MKADIVERLRAWVHTVKAVPASDIMDEAADEIDRLRAVAEGWAFKELDWTPTKPTHRKDGPPPTAMSFEPPTDGK
jgi:hypothetical protein